MNSPKVDHRVRAKQIAEQFGLVTQNAVRAIAAALDEGEAQGRAGTAEHAGPLAGTSSWPAIFEHVRPHRDE